MKINLKWLLLTSFILALIIVYYFRPKIIEGHKINNEWHTDEKKDSDGVLHSHPYSWSTNNYNTGDIITSEDISSNDYWINKARENGYNCFEQREETVEELLCRLYNYDCDTDSEIFCDSETSETCNKTSDSEPDSNSELVVALINPNTYSYGTSNSYSVSSNNSDTYSYGITETFQNIFFKKITETFTNSAEINFDKLTPILNNTTPFKIYHYNKNTNIYTFVTKNDENKYIFDNNLNTSARFKSVGLENYTVMIYDSRQNNNNDNNNFNTPEAVNSINTMDSTINLTKVDNTNKENISDATTSDAITSDTAISDATTSDAITSDDITSDIAGDIIKNLKTINNNLPNGIIFGPLNDISKPRCLSNEDSPAVVITLTCGLNPQDAPTRFILYGLANWNGSENNLSNFIKLIQVENIEFSEPYQENSYVFENQNCFLTSYHITFFHKDGPKLITLNKIQLYYKKYKCICCLGC